MENKFNLAIAKGLRRYIKSAQQGSDVRLVSIILTRIILCVCSDHLKAVIHQTHCRNADVEQLRLVRMFTACRKIFSDL